MAVAHSAASESHTGTTGSTNQAAFSWTHTQTGTPQGVVVFVSTYASVTSLVTSVTYGGVALTRLTGGSAQDAAGELGRMDAFFLGSGLGTGNQTITVNRTNNATVMYAAAATVTAGANTAVPEATIVLLQGDGTLTVQSVDDTSPGQNSLRYAGTYSGLNAPPAAGTGSTLLNSIDIGNYGSALVRETTAGQGARNVGFTGATDDRAAVHLAIRELVPRTETPIVGAFTLTGNDADLAKAGVPKVMDGGTGAFTFTGNAADLRHNAVIEGGTGAFTLAGQPADARHNVRIEGGTGAFTLTGNDATLAKASAKAITADRGQFTLTGNDATLKQGYALAGDTGAFALTGNPATLADTDRIEAGTGTFALAGNPATLKQGYALAGGTGAFTFTGNPATLTKTAADELSAIAGPFTLSGNAATLKRSWSLAGDRGAFTLTGQAATLARSRLMTGARGQFLLTGNQASLIVARAMLGSRGAFTFTGNPVTFADTDQLAAELGAFTFTGNAALLAKSGAGGRRRNVLIF
jgi:hypothetical protein